MGDLTAWLLDTSLKDATLNAGEPSWVALLFLIANLVMATSFAMLPLILLSCWPYQRCGVDRRWFWRVMMMAPVLALSRAVRVASLWGPFYHLTTVIDAFSAIVSLYSLWCLLPLIVQVLQLPSRESVVELTRRLADETNRGTELQFRMSHWQDLFTKVTWALRRGIDSGDTIETAKRLDDLMLLLGLASKDPEWTRERDDD